MRKQNLIGKRQLSIAAVSMCLIGSMAMLPGCGGDEPVDTAQGSAPVESAQTQQEVAEPQEASEYAVTIDACTTTADYEGAPAIIVDYTFTNNSDEAVAFAFACNAKVFQNGVQLEPAIVTEDLGNGYTAEIKPGATTPARIAYSITDQSDVTVEVEKLISLDDTLLAEKTFSLA